MTGIARPRRFSQLIDVRESGIRGVGDETALFQTLVNQLPQMDQSWGEATIAWEAGGASGLTFPTRMVLGISEPITWPNKRPIVLKAETAWGARINYTGDGACFRTVASSVGMSCDVDGMVLDNAAFAFGGSFRGHVRFRNNNFVGTLVPAIDFGMGAATKGVTFGDVSNNNFYRCAGGVWQRVETTQLLTIRKNRFNASHDIPIWGDTLGMHIFDNDIQSVDDPATPYIRFGLAESSNDLVVFMNRFGNEEFTAGGSSYFPPEAYIVAHDEAGINPVNGVTIRDNMVGTAVTPTATKSKHFIRLKSRPGTWTVEGNKLGRFFGAYVDEAWIADTTASAYARSYWGNNQTVSTHEAGVFSHGGVGWRQ